MLPRQLEREAFQQQQRRLADEVQHQQRARHEKERQGCQELLEQVRQRQVRLAQRQVSMASASPECVPRAVTDDTETPSGSPFAALLEEAGIARDEGDPLNAKSSNQSSCVTPKRPQPKGSTRTKSKGRAKQTATPGTGSSRKQRNSVVSSEQFIAVAKQHDFQPTPKKLKEQSIDGALDSEADGANEAVKTPLELPGELSTTVAEPNKDEE
jgi:hypothetical protein